MSVQEVIEIATAASAKESANRRGDGREGSVRCQAADMRKASSMPTAKLDRQLHCESNNEKRHYKSDVKAMQS